jgi:hypothetical protein
MTDLIKLLIEKNDPQTLTTLTYSLSHSNSNKADLFKQAIAINDPKERKVFSDQHFEQEPSATTLKTHSTPSTPIPKSQTTLKEISLDLKPNDRIQIKNKTYTVIKVAGDGKRSVVFQVTTKDGKKFALKVAKNQKQETLESLEKESAKAKKWNSLKILHSEVLVQEKTYVLKTWIEGLRGDEVIEKYLAGDASMNNAAKKVLELVNKIMQAGAYIGDFRPDNLIWTGEDWVIVDSGSIQQGMTAKQAEEKWLSADHRGPKFERRWKIKPFCENPLKQLNKLN